MTSSLHADIAHDLAQLRERVPLVQCLTNSVVTGFTANVLLAAGASPAMVDIPGEAGVFATVASGVLINLGTPHGEQRTAMREAASAAKASDTPWVLDPVAIGALPIRTELAHELVGLSPAIIRGNPSEIIALAGEGGGGRGVDATDSAEAALPAATDLARRHKTTVAVSGAVDLITDGTSVVRLANGSPLLTSVTGGGCALGALMAGFVGAQGGSSAGPNALRAAVSATAVYTVAAECAAVDAKGPGSFAVSLIDSLASVSVEQIQRLVRVRS